MSYAVMSEDEQQATYQGETYYAVSSSGCSGCRMGVSDQCAEVRCNTRERKDRRSVIFVAYAEHLVHRMRGTV